MRLSVADEAAPSWLTGPERRDPDVLRFIAAARRAAQEEKTSDPSDWTPEQRAAYERGDWRTFSRLRGYTDGEIANFAEFMRLAGVLDRRYGDDFAASLSFAVDEYGAAANADASPP